MNGAVSKNRQFLEAHGWRLWSRRKMGMYIKERWYHPYTGAVTFNQTQAIIEQRRINREHSGQRGLVETASSMRLLRSRLF